MKVLFIAADFYPKSTGFANATLNLLCAIRNNYTEYELSVFTTIPLGDSDEIEGIDVLRFPQRRSKLCWLFQEIKKYRYLKDYIIKNNVERIFFETNTFTILQNLLLKDFRDIISVRIHSTLDTEVLLFENNRNMYGKWLRRQDLKFMFGIKNVISTNNYYKEFIKREFYKSNVYDVWNDKNYYILPNTVILDSDVELTVNNQRYILAMGKMSYNGFVQKGLQDLVKALFYLKSNNELQDNFRIKIIGDGDCRHKLIEYANRLGVTTSIDFIRKTTHKESLSLIKGSLAICLLSRYEGQSMFASEAISLGKPLIITDGNGMSDMILPGINGYVVETGNYEEAAKAIKGILTLNLEQINAMGMASKEIFDKRFSPVVIARKFDEIMKMMI